MSAHVVPTSGICESRTLWSAAPPAGIEPAAIEPAAVVPRPIEPAGIEPAAIEPAAIEPAAIEPAAIDPAGIEPAAIEPAAIEPAAADWTSAVSDGSREAGIAPNGTEAMPAGMYDSSEVIVRELTVCCPTVTVTCCCVRSAPSATTGMVKL